MEQLPSLNGKKRYLKDGKRQNEHICEGCKWRIRGIAADGDILNALQEKRKWEFSLVAVPPEEWRRKKRKRMFSSSSIVTYSVGDATYEVLVPQWDGWEAATPDNAESFQLLGNGRYLSEGLLWNRAWVPYRERFTDDNYNVLAQKYVRAWEC